MTFPFNTEAPVRSTAAPLRFRALGHAAVKHPEAAAKNNSNDDIATLRSSLAQAEEQHQIDLEFARQQAEADVRTELLEQVNQTVDEMRQKVADALNLFRTERDRYFADAEGEVVKLALAVARRVLDREAKLDPLMLRGVVHVALGDMNAEEEMVMRVPLQDREEWSHAISQPSLKIEGDEMMKAGECRIQLKCGTVDLGVEAQLAEIETSFCELLRKRPE